MPRKELVVIASSVMRSEAAPTPTRASPLSSLSSRKRPRHTTPARSTVSNMSRGGYGALRSLFDGGDDDDDGGNLPPQTAVPPPRSSFFAPSLSSSPPQPPHRRRRSEDDRSSTAILLSTASPHGRVRRESRETGSRLSPGETTDHHPPPASNIDDATQEEDEEATPTTCPTGAPTGEPDRPGPTPRRRIAPQQVAPPPPPRSTSATTTATAAVAPPSGGRRGGTTVAQSSRQRSPQARNRCETLPESPTGEASLEEATGDPQSTGGDTSSDDTSSDGDNDCDYVDDDTWKSLVPGAGSTGETFYDDGTGTKPVHSSTVRFGLQVLEEERKAVLARYRASATQQVRASRPSSSLQRVSSEIGTAVRDRLRHQPLPGVYVRLEDACTDQLAAATRDRRDASRVGHARALRLARHGTRLGNTRNRLWEEVSDLEQRCAQPVDPYRLHPRLRAEDAGRPDAIGTTAAGGSGNGDGNQPFVRPIRFRPAPEGTLKLVLHKWRLEGSTVD